MCLEMKKFLYFPAISNNLRFPILEIHISNVLRIFLTFLKIEPDILINYILIKNECMGEIIFCSVIHSDLNLR